MKKILIIFFIIMIFILVVIASISNNVDALCTLSGAFGTQSCLGKYFIERIYKIAEKKDISDIFIDNLKNDNKRALHFLYLRIIGVIGEKKALNDFTSIYIEHQDEKESIELFFVLDCIGLLGEEKAVIFLEKIINKKGQWADLNYLISKSLYLLTGKKYDIINPEGEMEKFYVTDELIKAREVMLASKDRKRTFREMVILDNLFRR
ncbi:MAG: hypothetical protein OEW18_04110 [Candidatus Aminicenantes bacterium]|nr:hypothetical protein [Candidatus Aminicenantes bacterium]